MKYRLSKHAIDVMKARNINEDWVEYTVDNPSLKSIQITQRSAVILDHRSL